MNASYDPLRLINTYGAFGVVDEEREEFIIRSSADRSDKEEDWREYEFKVKPGNTFRRPKWITPYHYRLDWQLCIASSCRTLDRSPWVYRFLLKLLQKDKVIQQLIERDPWDGDAEKPKYIRIDSYRYKFHNDRKSDRSGKMAPFWDREFLRQVYPPPGNFATVESLKDDIQSVSPDRPV